MSLYEHAGGQADLQRFIDIFYRNVLADPILVPLFGTGRPEHVAHLAAFDAECFGGPDTFTREMGGFAHLIEVHRGLKITEQQRQRFVELYLAAADEARLPGRRAVPRGAALPRRVRLAGGDAELTRRDR